MNEFLNFMENENAFFIFDHLTVEIHIWKIKWKSEKQVETWSLIYANPPALKTWGESSIVKIVGKTTDEIFGSGATEHYLPLVQKIVDENKPHTYRDYFEHLDRHFRFTTVPLGNYFITTGDDITEFVLEKESALLEKKELEHLVKMRTAKLKTTEEEIKILRGIIPICSYCHNIRNEDGAWDQLEAYISEHSDAFFSHGVCPDCRARALADMDLSEVD